MTAFGFLEAGGTASHRGVVLILAVGFEALYSELPSRVHPVVWMGNLIHFGLRFEPAGNWGRFGFGLVLTLTLTSLVGGVFYFVSSQLPAPVSYFAEAILLHSTFAVRGLLEEGERMRRALAQSLAQARAALTHLCSRNPAQLTEPQLIGATIESLIENTCDSFIAPLAYYAIAGIPAAAAYRAVNTLDSMIGYRGRYEYTGKFAARLDDVLNFIPARIGGALILLVGAARRHSVRRGLATWWTERSNTSSPNAGVTMSIAAGLLGVTLEKAGEYRLNGGQSPLSVSQIRETEIWVGAVFGLWVVVLGAGLSVAARLQPSW